MNNSIKNQFIKHVEGDAQTALEGTFIYARKGLDNELYYDFELKAKENRVTFKATLKSDTSTEVINKDFGFIYNSPGNGAMIWKYIINYLWYTLSYDERLYDSFMKLFFDCDINDLYEGNF